MINLNGKRQPRFQQDISKAKSASFKTYLSSLTSPGSLPASIFSLTVICLGAGTLSIPYVFYANGLLFGTVILLCGGAGLSFFSGWLMVECCNIVGTAKLPKGRKRVGGYEEIAMHAYGGKAALMTSWCMLACLVGFIVSYIVLFKELMPFTMEKLTGTKLPDILSTGFTGKTFWSFIFCFILVLPISFARTLSALHFTSFFSLCISIYLVLAIVCTCLFDKGVTPSVSLSFQTAFTSTRVLGWQSFLNSLPVVMFSFLYQTNIPMIYNEIEVQTTRQMWKVMQYTTIGAVVAYLLAGVFGFVTFSLWENVDELMERKNILLSYPEEATSSYISLLGMMGVLLLNTPLTILPCKDTLETIMLPRGRKFSTVQNIKVTLGLVTVCFIFSIAITNIGDAITLLGATTNPIIAFILPCLFYLKLTEDDKSVSFKQRLFAQLMIAFVGMSSINGLWQFFVENKQEDKQEVIGCG
ncbi:hypothetical protein FGO68_gene1776 [Halteria grandinella]|uniref:Amino acid transporter transmembrane domain-containing protein n=1 Tax=Halteria grandinella TaxID=5974 RepID=A0A8J8NRJ2_HALGN|nr:hypothetical protein FGO68_gene1776 [Halteria grandinella]